jgi:hypothetical protein
LIKNDPESRIVQMMNSTVGRNNRRIRRYNMVFLLESRIRFRKHTTWARRMSIHDSIPQREAVARSPDRHIPIKIRSSVFIRRFENVGSIPISKARVRPKKGTKRFGLLCPWRY